MEKNTSGGITPPESQIPDWYLEDLHREGLPEDLRGPVDLDEQVYARAAEASAALTAMVSGLRRYRQNLSPQDV
ncbi:MAG TPA: hypothetical protein VJP80_07790 [Candidatus Saccharimonadales bacterium]|nr:hypothetical protein [Candidatus Saccharimonadales bacterium]